jgi:glyoxylase-like metal-dependent hydrolase (beta-lactamase superfamily II)
MLHRNTRSASTPGHGAGVNVSMRVRFRDIGFAPVFAVVLLAALAAARVVHAASVAPRMLAPGVYVVPGDDGDISAANLGRIANAAFIIGPRGVVVVESGVSFRHGEAIIAAVATVTRRPIRLVVITHAGQEVLFGAAAFQARGIPVLMHRDAAQLMAARCATCLQSLVAALGAQPMAGSRVATPDTTVAESKTVDVTGRPLRLIAPASASSPGALAVFDAATRTLIAGSLVTIDRVPDMRDADGRGWRAGLAVLAATHCRHLVPAFGRVGNCADIVRLDRYFADLAERVRMLIAAGAGLADVAAGADLPEYAGWNRYPQLHPANANRAYLAIERAAFSD